jgi:hypothetical protein
MQPVAQLAKKRPLLLHCSRFGRPIIPSVALSRRDRPQYAAASLLWAAPGAAGSPVTQQAVLPHGKGQTRIPLYDVLCETWTSLLFARDSAKVRPSGRLTVSAVPSGLDRHSLPSARAHRRQYPQSLLALGTQRCRSLMYVNGSARLLPIDKRNSP